MKILNIDDFAKVERQISYKGKSYPIEDLDVQQFIDNLKAAESLEAAGTKVSLSQAFEQGVTAICQAIPSLPEAEVRKLKVSAMSAVLQFIRGELDPDARPGEGATPQEGAAEKKPS